MWAVSGSRFLPALFVYKHTYYMLRFSDYLAEKQGYPNEELILSQLANMSLIQQALLDKKLHTNAIQSGGFDSEQLSQDQHWKDRFIEILRGKVYDPETIVQTINIIKRDMKSHKNRNPSMKTGSAAWHSAWLQVYQNWLSHLENILGALNGSKKGTEA